MTKNRIISFVILITGLFSCANNQAPKKQLIGKWTMTKVYDGEKDITNKMNPKNNRWIKFNRNGSFESDGDPHGYNDGNWELDPEKLILFLDSKLEGDDSEWKIAFDGNTTIWTGIGTPRQERFKLIHKKIE
ncbi:hypothetical protein LPB03_11915 [Polaribacter vadi]|uniref:Lipocalin-like domain-containing protein n=1 Tax=Polaribacter vadi TaxID=1774273 RepID=A0A1B8TTJ4_9FLAO|nr:DUF5004 domain-containing protein [Polaribacter vadi]AOW18116.1 hypothetical protein LPB03_11915 [Polaribacter vadi]OBY62844.1 hypothetical protein LPB3_11925 [Polaribacter vadi]